MNAVDIVAARLTVEEGFKAFPYDDATGQLVKAPQGNLTQGYGCNLSAGWSKGLAICVMHYQLQDIETQLIPYSWYQNTDPIRQSVLLDIGFNAGINGLLHFPHMLAAFDIKDWQAASEQCEVADQKLNSSRYAPLRKIILAGVV